MKASEKPVWNFQRSGLTPQWSYPKLSPRHHCLLLLNQNNNSFYHTHDALWTWQTNKKYWLLSWNKGNRKKTIKVFENVFILLCLYFFQMFKEINWFGECWKSLFIQKIVYYLLETSDFKNLKFLRKLKICSMQSSVQYGN